ncbi:hypothetical protein IW262DRAFT_1400923 [Armillaria fumosa]|nr:hypothetical protein IW262DRAFT_1400923 [Armillaria fumosa]
MSSARKNRPTPPISIPFLQRRRQTAKILATLVVVPVLSLILQLEIKGLSSLTSTQVSDLTVLHDIVGIGTVSVTVNSLHLDISVAVILAEWTSSHGYTSDLPFPAMEIKADKPKFKQRNEEKKSSGSVVFVFRHIGIGRCR